MTTTTNLIELVNDYGRACRIYGNPAWDCREGVALKATIEAQAKQIESLQSQLDDYLMMTAKVEALQAEAERYRVGREAAFAGLLVDFPHTKTWSDAMDFAYDQMIAARKGNV